METKRKIKLLKLTFLAFNLSCIVAIMKLYSEIFPNLKEFFSVYHISLYHLEDVRNILIAIPGWPVVFTVLSISACLACSRYIYKAVIAKI